LNVKEVIEADQIYEQTYIDQPEMSAKRHFAILTCMDPRIDPNKILGLKEGDAVTIRNAGGRASDDAIRSLIVSYKLLGTKEWFVIHHTDCGMQKFNNDVMGCLLEHSLETAHIFKNCNVDLRPVESVCRCEWKDTGKCPGSIVGRCIDWLPILHGLEKSVIDDVSKIRHHPLIPQNIPIYGYIFDIHTGHLIPVPAAMEIGRATRLCCCLKHEQKEKICKCKKDHDEKKDDEKEDEKKEDEKKDDEKKDDVKKEDVKEDVKEDKKVDDKKVDDKKEKKHDHKHGKHHKKN